MTSCPRVVTRVISGGSVDNMRFNGRGCGILCHRVIKMKFFSGLKKIAHGCGIVYVFGGGVVSNVSVISYATYGICIRARFSLWSHYLRRLTTSALRSMFHYQAIAGHRGRAGKRDVDL